MKYVQFWRPGEIYKKISLAEPRLESWNAKSAPDQLKLQQYLDDIERNVGILPQSTDLFLHIDIDVKKREFLLHHHDLDNYLYPVVNRLRPYHFKYVSASKQVGSGSLLSIGQAKQLDDIADEQSWQHFYYQAGNDSLQKPLWKGKLREALQNHRFLPIKPGPVEVHLAWRCSSRRNWATLWKPTIDAMGPILGEPFTNRPFYPKDDRITSLGLHLQVDDMIGWSVHIGMMWRASST